MCKHVGPYRAVAGGRFDDDVVCAVICIACGAHQFVSKTEWCSSKRAINTYLEGSRFRILDAPLGPDGPLGSLKVAQRFARDEERELAIKGRWVHWFHAHDERPPWWPTTPTIDDVASANGG